MASGSLHRHHLRHEAMWFGIWASRRRHETKWREFLDRYYEFRPEDTVILCARHHAEIHKIYDRLIQQDRKALNKGLAAYTWNQAETLMAKLEDECLRWLRLDTPGIDPRELEQQRRGMK